MNKILKFWLKPDNPFKATECIRALQIPEKDSKRRVWNKFFEVLDKFIGDIYNHIDLIPDAQDDHSLKLFAIELTDEPKVQYGDYVVRIGKELYFINKKEFEDMMNVFAIKKVTYGQNIGMNIRDIDGRELAILLMKKYLWYKGTNKFCITEPDKTDHPTYLCTRIRFKEVCTVKCDTESTYVYNTDYDPFTMDYPYMFDVTIKKACKGLDDRFYYSVKAFESVH